METSHLFSHMYPIPLVWYYKTSFSEYTNHDLENVSKGWSLTLSEAVLTINNFYNILMLQYLTSFMYLPTRHSENAFLNIGQTILLLSLCAHARMNATAQATYLSLVQDCLCGSSSRSNTLWVGISTVNKIFLAWRPNHVIELHNSSCMI
jgi:hypothetical protein